MPRGIRIAVLGLLLSLGLFGCGSDGGKNPVNPGGSLELNSGDINPGNNFQHMFATAGTFGYHCTRHSAMTGSVTVQSGGPATASVNIANSTSAGFQPGTVTVGVGGTVTWTNGDGVAHTVTSH